MNRASASEQQEPMGGGGLGGAVRVGNTVRREASHWTPTVHALLDHLEAVGFDGAPRAHGFDDKGREVLSYMEGSAGPSTGWPEDDAALAGAARLIRRYHDAVEGFVPPEDASWQFMVGAARHGPIVGHNDLAPGNTIYTSRRAVSLIDWDFAAPATRVWDVAYALYRFVPLYPDDFFEHRGVRPPDRARRLQFFCETYGLEERAGLIDVVRRRVEVLYDSVRTWGEAGLRRYAKVWADTQGRQWLETIAYIDKERDRWERALE